MKEIGYRQVLTSSLIKTSRFALLLALFIGFHLVKAVLQVIHVLAG